LKTHLPRPDDRQEKRNHRVGADRVAGRNYCETLKKRGSTPCVAVEGDSTVREIAQKTQGTNDPANLGELSTDGRQQNRKKQICKSQRKALGHDQHHDELSEPSPVAKLS